MEMRRFLVFFVELIKAVRKNNILIINTRFLNDAT